MAVFEAHPPERWYRIVVAEPTDAQPESGPQLGHGSIVRSAVLRVVQEGPDQRIRRTAVTAGQVVRAVRHMLRSVGLQPRRNRIKLLRQISEGLRVRVRWQSVFVHMYGSRDSAHISRPRSVA